MTNEEILARAIPIAIKNGYTTSVSKKLGSYVKIIGGSVWMTDKHGDLEMDAYRVIFSHQFAKAFWGDMTVVEFSECPTCEYPAYHKEPAWKYHLQVMVLEPDPIKYLEKFL